MASTLTDLFNSGTAALNPSTTTNSGSGNTGVNPFSVLGSLYDTIEVRSNAAPPVSINVNDLGAGGPPNPASQALQPTIIFTGNAGRYALAPYGEASPTTGWLASVGGFFALLGAGFLLGRLTK